MDFSNPFDLFETFFGGGMGQQMGGRNRNAPRQGDDERYDLEISFSDAVFGEPLCAGPAQAELLTARGEQILLYFQRNRSSCSLPFLARRGASPALGTY